jgi:two-component system sensor histidine kinase AlgZ
MRRAAKPGSSLPDFCSLEAVFPVVVIGELLAFVMVLRPGVGLVEPWRDLALASLFIQWVGLTSIATLCVTAPSLRKLSAPAAAGLAWLIVVFVVLALSEVTYWASTAGWLGSSMDETGVISDTVFWLTQAPWIGLDLSAARHADFLIRTTTIGAIVGAVALRYVHVQYQHRREAVAQAEARVAALQARIRPHFLFNSMNTIVSFVRTQPEIAEQVVEDLSDLFRASLDGDDSRADLRSELEIARGYLRIEALRLGERLRITWDVDSLPADALVPRLTLQPLVENAVYHGIERLDEGGEVRVTGRYDGRELTLEVSNPVPVGVAQRPGHQVAQRSVFERLSHQHPGRAAVDVDAQDGHYTVTLKFPYETLKS